MIGRSVPVLCIRVGGLRRVVLCNIAYKSVHCGAPFTL